MAAYSSNASNLNISIDREELWKPPENWEKFKGLFGAPMSFPTQL
jgi:hypothetical protein